MQDKKSSTTQNNSQSLQSQNVFDLLGVTSGTNEQKDNFLDEIQQAIWDDFVQYDLELLISKQDMVKANEIMKQPITHDQKQIKLVEFLEKIIPDLEEILLRKALKTKRNLVIERVVSLQKLYASDKAAMDKLEEAKVCIEENRWTDCKNILNSLA